ncbi:hypothetical protein M5K25_002483 [Dendrobium thyrsiflorum]|uniref:Uncharacterized protein n=1 Tax=Dendrobium thyrsiflorum TaxID=117978 RepID=A0ABD0VMN8_DENTH
MIFLSFVAKVTTLLVRLRACEERIVGEAQRFDLEQHKHATKHDLLKHGNSDNEIDPLLVDDLQSDDEWVTPKNADIHEVEA